MDKEAVVHICNRILLNHKKGHIWVSPSEVDDLKPNIKSEVSQKEKNKYHLLLHIYEIYKDDSDEPIHREAMKMQT